jgi:hypothetical protein
VTLERRREKAKEKRSERLGDDNCPRAAPAFLGCKENWGSRHPSSLGRKELCV